MDDITNQRFKNLELRIEHLESQLDKLSKDYIDERLHNLELVAFLLSSSIDANEEDQAAIDNAMNQFTDALYSMDKIEDSYSYIKMRVAEGWSLNE